MANRDHLLKVDVCLSEHNYSIYICRNGLNNADLLRQIAASSQVLIVTNHTIAPFYLNSIQSAFSDRHCNTIILPDGEQYKDHQSLFQIIESLIVNQYHRDCLLVALGGGVVGDLTGFAASIYQRGCKYLQIPTSLLAQVDASVGGKTAINYNKGKNILGSFYQPDAVLIDPLTLNTLPKREFVAGIAEIIKYGLLEGGATLQRLQELLSQGVEAFYTHSAEVIEMCCRIKVKYVENDEKEQNERALLNLGHTFAHALESYTDYKQWLHGEAVAIGLHCAALLSHQMNLLSLNWLKVIQNMIRDIGLPWLIPKNTDLNQLIELMQHDKKIKNNRLRFILIKKPGACYLETEVSKEQLLLSLQKAQ